MRSISISSGALLAIWWAWLPAGPSIAQGAEDSAAERLLDRIVAREQNFVTRLKTRSAIVETYIQETPEGSSDILRDHYFLGKLDFGDGLRYTTMAAHSDVPKSFKLWSLLKGRAAVFMPVGFAQMVLIDADGFNRESYRIEYVRREFLGEVRCLSFDVAPVQPKASGKFKGRIWVEEQGLQIVRFNGVYTNGSSSHIYFHFDSWRVNVAEDVWVPAFIYVEESGSTEKGPAVPHFKAQTRLWGYDTAKNGRIGELASIAVEAEKGLQDRSGSSDLTPLESQRSWERQAESNILDRLEKAGLLAPPGPVDEVLNGVVNNLIAATGLNIEAYCRVLLTTPLETFSVGRTIVVSRGLLDVLPDEASLAMVLSGELAHIVLGHRTDTHFAFADETMLNEQELLARLRLARSEEEVRAAGEKAVEILKASSYAPKMTNAGLFLEALASRAPQLPNLIRPNLGNQLAGGSGQLRMQQFVGRAPALEQDKLEQLAALPLGSRVRLDPWSNGISLIKAKPVSLLSARDKLRFEVTPFMIFLSRATTRPEAQDPAPGNPGPVQH